MTDPKPRKHCSRCGESKTLNQFYRHPSGVNGYDARCKMCARAAVKENRELKAEVYRERERERYAADPEYRARKLAYCAVYQKTARGRESRRISQRVYRAWRRATGAPPFPSDRPEIVAERNRQFAARRRRGSGEKP